MCRELIGLLLPLKTSSVEEEDHFMMVLSVPLESKRTERHNYNAHSVKDVVKHVLKFTPFNNIVNYFNILPLYFVLNTF